MATSSIAEGTNAGKDDSIKLLTIFPTEIWHLIANSVYDPEDLYKMAKASPFLETLLEPNKDMYHFYLALKIRDRHSHSLMIYNDRPPNLCDLLGTNELLKCRLVCSAWKTAVNRFLEARPHHSNLSTRKALLPLAMQEFRDPTYRAYFHLKMFTRVAGLDAQLLSEISTPSSIYKRGPLNNCPSPTRHLEIEQVGLNRPANIHNFAKQFLEQVGHTFHHLTIKGSSWQLVSEYMECMPNLRSLYILPLRTDSVDDIAVSFPSLKNLNLISLNDVSDPVSKMVFEANPWAKVVEIFRSREHSRRINPELETGNMGAAWPVNPTSISTAIISPHELAEMPTSWKLNVLKLNFLGDELTKWSTIFRKVECYQNTLTELYLELPKYGKDTTASAESGGEIGDASKMSLNLPMLKRLEVKVKKMCSLDFLLGLTTLEHLRLCLEDGPEDGITQEEFSLLMMETVDYKRGFSERYKEGKIWELMGNLNVVELRKWRLTIRMYRKMSA